MPAPAHHDAWPQSRGELARELLRGLAAGDEIAVVNDDRGYAVDAPLAPKHLLGTDLIGVSIRGERFTRFGAVQPGRFRRGGECIVITWIPLIDLGDVRDIAEVRVNGTDQGLAWAPPCNVDITKGLQAGRNTLEIRVTNEWTNRIEGDKNLPDGRKVRKRGLKAAVQAAWAMG